MAEMDSSEVEDQQDQEDQSGPNKSSSNTSGGIVEGKRAKKSVERFDFQAPKQKEKLKFGDGSGDKLGDIPRTGHQITRMKAADLKPLHFILFDRPGKMASLKKNLRLFNGFPFDAASGQFSKKREKLLKNSNFTNSKLKVVCSVLDLEKKGTHPDLVDRILLFLIAPKNSGKRLPVKKKRKSKKKLSGEDSKSSSKKKSRPFSSSSSPKKSKPGSKSKAIVMETSSDEEEEEKEKAEEGSDTEDKQSEKEEDQSDKSEESSEEEEEEQEEPLKSKSVRGKSASKKTAQVKRQRTPTKKSGPPKNRTKKEVSEESESDANEKPSQKKWVKPTPKTKKADSSSHSKHNTNTAEDDSSDDDAPLIKMVKKTPSEEQLRDTVKKLLEEADLEEMTMKQICQRVFDTYPNHDLSSKKDFIKQTVKSLIS